MTIDRVISIKHPITTGTTSSSSTKFLLEEKIISSTITMVKRKRLCTTKRKICTHAKEESPQMAHHFTRNISTLLQELVRTSITIELL